MKNVFNFSYALLAFLIGTAMSYSGVRVAAENTVPSKGRVPSEALDASGRINVALVPDFIVALKRDGSIAGYVAKGGIFRGSVESDERPAAPNLPVFDEALEHVVGHMVPGQGFVQLGSRIEDFPALAVTASESPASQF